MKKILCLAALLFAALTSSVQAQNSAVTISSSTNESVRMKLTASDMAVSTVVFAADTFSRIEMVDFAGSNKVGCPDLPVLNKMIEIPVGASVRVNIVSEHHKTLSGSSIGLDHRYFPTQPARRKSDTSAPVLSIDNAAYARNAFYSNQLVAVENAGIARDRNLAVLSFSPVQYNPVTNEVVLYDEVEVSLEFVGADLAATQSLKRLHGNAAFGSGIRTLNSLPATKDMNVSSPIRYTIIAHSSFRGQLDSFVAWKKRIGYLVDIHYTDESEIGTTTTTIQSYLQSQYTNATATMPAPTYVLLVGDHAQIPAFAGRNTLSSSWGSYSSRVSDLYYFTWTGNDNIPDCYYGRFSAQNVSQLTPQIEKTLTYEQYQFQAPAFLDKGLIVAGTDQGSSSDNGYTYADPTMDYIVKNYVNGDHGFTQVHYYKNNSSSNPNASNVTVYSNGGYSAYSTSNSVAQAVKNEVNEGRGWFNYSAHGDWDGFSIPAFGNDQVASLSANNKYGVIIGNCCLTNSFQQSSCFGETLLRKSGAGAVAYIGASDYTYWGQDYSWAVGCRTSSFANPTYNASNLGCYDRMCHTHGEAFNQWATTVGSLMYAGNMAVQAMGNSTYSHYYWEVYHLMGDPSLQPWMGQAQEMPLTYAANMLFTAQSYDVTAAPYAYVALTRNGEMVVAQFADANGHVSFPMNQLSIGTYELAATAQFYQPAFRTVTIVAGNGPYILGSNITPAEDLTAGSIVNVKLDIENVGNETASSIDVVLNGDPAFVTPIRNHTQAVNLTPDYRYTIDGEFLFLVNADVQDMDQCLFEALITWAGADDTTTAVQMLTLSAPSFKATNIEENHTSSTVSINCVNTNCGHADASDVEVDLFCGHPSITITNPHHSIGDVSAGSTFLTSYSINVESTFSGNHAVQFLQRITDGVVTRIDTIEVTLSDGTDNGNARQFEGFESGNLTAFDWTNAGWIVTSSGKRSGSFCAKSNIADLHDSSAVLMLTYTSTSNDTISFYYKVSSENRYDKFFFYIDDDEKMNASGTSQNNYTRAAYPVLAGTHVFTFVYSKDGSVSSGDDCAWIDDITLPRSLVQDLYVYDTICQGASYTFQGQSLATESLEAGSYQLQASLAEGGTAYITLQVGIGLALSSDVEIEKGQSVVLIASGATSYEWSTGHTSSAIAVAPATTTTYTVTGHVGSCSEQASVTVTVNASSEGIADIEASPVAIYPNPASAQVAVEADDVAEIRLLNTLGQHIQVVRAQGSRTLISVASLPSGIYLLEVVRTDGTASVHKLIRK